MNRNPKFDLKEIVMRLNGQVKAIGESNEDERRYENLLNLIDLAEDLIFEIKQASRDANRNEGSMKKSGERAQRFIDEMKDI